MRGRSVEMRYAPDENAAKQGQREDSVRTSSIAKQSPKGTQGPMTIGLDIGDKTSRYCVLDESGEVQAEGSVATTKKASVPHHARTSADLYDAGGGYGLQCRRYAGERSHDRDTETK
jgi:hypothetical protein